MKFRSQLRLLIGLLILIILTIQTPSSNAQVANRAALLIQFGNGSIITQCISFDETSLTSLELLERSGLAIVSSMLPTGMAVCKIESQGCPASNCFCESPPDYWALWHLVDSDWTEAPFGPSNHRVQNNAVDAWTWGPGVVPPVIAFDQICASGIISPSNTPLVTNIPQPTNTRAPAIDGTNEAQFNPSIEPFTPEVSSTITEIPATATPTPVPPFFVLPPRLPLPQVSETPAVTSTSVATSSPQVSNPDQYPSEGTTAPTGLLLVGAFFLLLIAILLIFWIIRRR